MDLKDIRFRRTNGREKRVIYNTDRSDRGSYRSWFLVCAGHSSSLSLGKGLAGSFHAVLKCGDGMIQLSVGGLKTFLPLKYMSFTKMSLHILSTAQHDLLKKPFP